MRKELLETLGFTAGRMDANADGDASSYGYNDYADFNPLMKKALTAHWTWASSS